MVTEWQERIHEMSNAVSVPDGGFTVGPKGGCLRAGYVVAAHPGYERILDSHASMAELRESIENFLIERAAPGRMVGGWHNPATGRIHLDVCVITRSRSTALAIARVRHQFAVFDLARSVVIRVSDAPGQDEPVQAAVRSTRQRAGRGLDRQMSGPLR